MAELSCELQSLRRMNGCDFAVRQIATIVKTLRLKPERQIFADGSVNKASMLAAPRHPDSARTARFSIYQKCPRPTSRDVSGVGGLARKTDRCVSVRTVVVVDPGDRKEQAEHAPEPMMFGSHVMMMSDFSLRG